MTHFSHSPMRSPLGRVRGHGSARQGVEHWWLQRLTSIALVPLVLWFLWLAFGIAGLEGNAQSTHRVAYLMLGTPLNSILAVLLIVCLFHHMQLGLQVIIEDYVPHAPTKFFFLIALKLFSVALALACTIAVLSIAL